MSAYMKARVAKDRPRKARWRAANRDKTAAYWHAWKERNPEAAAEQARAATVRYSERHPERGKAHDAIYHAIKTGKLTREPCGKCGATPAQAHHHLGYAPEHRLDVVWRCRRCHRLEHAVTPS